MNLIEATIKALNGQLTESYKLEAGSHKEDNEISNKKITEATTDVNEVVEEYKEAYHVDLNLKTVPCVIARDKMLSGWGGAEGRNHYQVVLCGDSTEAYNIAHNMQAVAQREQLANIRTSFGVKLPSRASVAYCVGRYASAWNMSDSWYERFDYDTKIDEAKNPANDDINTKIRKTINGSTKYLNDLENAGLDIKKDNNEKVIGVGKGDKYISKPNLKNAHPDTDYYNYLTKEKITPEVEDTGAFAPTNIFRNSDNFEKTIGGNDTTYMRTDRNGVSKAIPKKYKTGNKNYNIDLDKFPRKSYNGVASYEPLDNDELKDFKVHKRDVDYMKADVDKAKAEYDKVKKDYDEVNDKLTLVRDRIAKSKERATKVEAKKTYDDYEQEIYYLQDIIDDWEMKGRGNEKDYNWAVRRLKSIKRKLNDNEYFCESRKNPEVNNKVAPRNQNKSDDTADGVNTYSWKYAGSKDGVGRVVVKGDPNFGKPVGYDRKRDRVRSVAQAKARKNAGPLDFAGMTDMQNYEVNNMNKDSEEYKELKQRAEIARATANDLADKEMKTKYNDFADKADKEADEILIKRGIKN